MPRRTTKGKAEVNRAAIYARVSDKIQDEEDKTSISEQIGEMEAYCESKGLTITEAGEFEDPLVCYHRARGMEVSGYGVDEEEGRVDLFRTFVFL